MLGHKQHDRLYLFKLAAGHDGSFRTQLVLMKRPAQRGIHRKCETGSGRQEMSDRKWDLLPY